MTICDEMTCIFIKNNISFHKEQVPARENREVSYASRSRRCMGGVQADMPPENREGGSVQRCLSQKTCLFG